VSVEQVLLGGAAIVGSLGGLAALIKAVYDRRAGISGNERQARRDAAEDRRDTIADRDELLRTVLAEVRDLRGRVEMADRGLRLRDDHIDALEHHIYQGKPPPPPPRPAGV
jgi:erythromycin esterase-like protein